MVYFAKVTINNSTGKQRIIVKHNGKRTFHDWNYEKDPKDNCLEAIGNRIKKDMPDGPDFFLSVAIETGNRGYDYACHYICRTSIFYNSDGETLQLNEASDALRELTRMTEDFGGYEKERARYGCD
jgi:hypothetical protein